MTLFMCLNGVPQYNVGDPSPEALLSISISISMVCPFKYGSSLKYSSSV